MVANRGGRPYSEDPCPARGVGLSHIVVMSIMGPFCEACQQGVYIVDPSRGAQVQRDATRRADDMVTELRQKMIEEGRLDTSELALLRDLDAAPPREGRWITGDGPTGDRLGKGRSLTADERGRPFGHYRMKLMAQAVYWAARQGVGRDGPDPEDATDAGT